MRALLLASLPLVVACAHASLPAWLQRGAPSHPLVGRIWDVRTGAPIDWPALREALSGARFVLLGEKHDNADHHLLQARVVEALASTGAAGAVALEMFAIDVAPALAQALAREGVTAAEVRDAVAWEKSGWPDWALYAPIAEAALGAGLPLVAADLPRATRRKLGREGAGALSPERRVELGLDRPVPEDWFEAMAAQIRAAHCGYAPEEKIPRMIDVQRARDAQMARVLIAAAAAAAGGRGAILITGDQHARRDRGVPFYLESWLPEARALSLAFLEVDPDQTDLRRDLAARFGAGIPFDYLWYTPSTDFEDPCEKFREKLEGLRNPSGESGS